MAVTPYPDRLKSRDLSYEVHVSHDGRWIIDGTMRDEALALDYARILLAGGLWAEVRVLRIRHMRAGGFTQETEVLRLSRREAKDRPIQLTGIDTIDGADLCATPDDLYGLDGRMVLGRLLRRFLDKHAITATELLHGQPYQRRLGDAGPLILSAVHHLARVQAETTGAPAKERQLVLQNLVNQIMRDAHLFAVERRRLPKLQADNLEATSRQIQGVVAPERHSYALKALITEHFGAVRTLAGKQAQLLDWIAGDQITEGQDCALAGLIEGMVADTLGSAEQIKDLLGPQPHLAASLCIMADLVHGRPIPAPAKPIPALAGLAALLRAGRAPSCRVVLLDRLRQVLLQDQPLDKRDPNEGINLLKKVSGRLKDEDGRVPGGAALEQALTARALRERQAMLRRQGLDDVADALPRHYQPGIP